VAPCSEFGTVAHILEGNVFMDINKMLAELRDERQQIEEAIITLERLAKGRGKRRGRPPAWLADARVREKVRPKTATARTAAD
jgi:hypothetical protein